jgi:hypothetical protein
MSNRCFTLLGASLLIFWLLPLDSVGANRSIETSLPLVTNGESRQQRANHESEPARTEPASTQPAEKQDAAPDVQDAPDPSEPTVDPQLEPAPTPPERNDVNGPGPAPTADPVSDAPVDPEPAASGLIGDTMPSTDPTMPHLATEDLPVIAAPPPLQPEDLEAVTEALSARLMAIERSLSGQQDRAMAMVISSNRMALIVAGTFAGVGILGILLAAWVLARVLNRFSDVVMTLPLGQQLGRTSSLATLGYDETHPATTTGFEQVSARFLGAIEQLERRIRELEIAPPSRTHSSSGSQGNGGLQTAETTDASQGKIQPDSDSAGVLTEGIETREGAPERSEDEDIGSHHRVQDHLARGETLLQSDKVEEALEQFEDALALEPRNADALIKRGMALERLQRMEAALESYDRAIASNESLTLAYLHKGAVCNRLQRYREALECYERALQTEQKP